MAGQYSGTSKHHRVCGPVRASEVVEIPDLEAAAETPSSAETEIPEPAEGFNMQEYIIGLRKRLVERAMEMAAGRQNRASEASRRYPTGP